MKNFEFLFWAYNCVWVILAGYVTYLLTRVRRAERELRRLESALAGRRAAPPGGVDRSGP